MLDRLLDMLATVVALWTAQQLLFPLATRWLIRRLFDLRGCTCQALISVMWWAPIMLITLTPSKDGCTFHDIDRPDPASLADAEPDAEPDAELD